MTTNSTWPAELDACTVSDALDSLGVSLDALPLRALWAGARVAGPVVTVQLAEGPAPVGAPKLHLGVSAILRSRPGDVIVMANDGRTGMGTWGGMLTRAARARQVAGVVLDGDCRDLDEAREFGFPAFGRGTAVRTARGRIHEVSCGAPVMIGQTQVCTGDWVVADGSGVVFVPSALLGPVRARALELAGKEALMIERLEEGVDLPEVFGANYEEMLAARGHAGR